MYVYACYGVHYMCILHMCIHISHISLYYLYSTLVSSPARLSGFIIKRHHTNQVRPLYLSPCGLRKSKRNYSSLRNGVEELLKKRKGRKWRSVTQSLC